MQNTKIRAAITIFTALCAGLSGMGLCGEAPGILNHQGRIAVNGVNFDGSGQFKFALVNAAGDTAYWSNDATSTTGNEPTAAVSVPVSKGHYAALLGDAPMVAIPSSVFSDNADVRLRIWFSADGGTTFEQLAPDRRIASVGYALNSQTQTLSFAGSDLSLSGGGGTVSFAGAITTDMLAPGTLSGLGTSDGSSSIVLAVDNNGSVGLGTSLPRGALHIAGNLRALNSLSTGTSGFDFPQEVAGVYGGHIVVRTTTGIKFFDARDSDAVLLIDGPDFGDPLEANDAVVSGNALYVIGQFENKVTSLEMEIEQGNFRTSPNWSVESFVSGGGGRGGAGPTSIDASETHLFVTTGKPGDSETVPGTLRVLNAADGSAVGSIGLPSGESPYFVRVADGIAGVLSDGEESDGTPYEVMHLVDVSNPAAPFMVGSVKGDEFLNVLLSGGRAYVSGEDRVRIYDVSDPSSPVLLGEAVDHVRVVGGPESPFNLLMGAKGLSLNGTTLHVASGEDSSITLIDVTNPAAPALIDEIADGERGLGRLGGSTDLLSEGERSFLVAAGDHALTIFDLTPTGLVVESRVGIGTSDPTAELDVVGTVKATTLEGSLNGSFLTNGSVTASKLAIGSLDDADADPTNEIQTLSMAGSDLSLSKGGGTVSFAGAITTNMLAPGAVSGLDTPDGSATNVVRVDSEITGFEPAGTSESPGVLEDPEDITVVGDFAYVVDSTTGMLQIFDISDPAQIVVRDSDGTGLSNPGEVVVSGNYAYVADRGTRALQIFDVSDPDNIVPKAGLVAVSDEPLGLAVSGDFLFATYSSGRSSGSLRIFDVSDPNQFVAKDEVGLSSGGYVAVSGVYAYVSDSRSLHIFDVSDPDNIVDSGSIEFGVFLGGGQVVVSGNYVYKRDDGLVFHDLSDPGNFSAGYLSGSGEGPIAVSGNLLCEVDGRVKLFDVSDPRNAVLIDSIDQGVIEPSAVAMDGERIYVVDRGTDKLAVFDILTGRRVRVDGKLDLSSAGIGFPDGSLQTRAFGTGSVTSGDLAFGAVDSAAIQDGAITAADLASGALSWNAVAGIPAGFADGTDDVDDADADPTNELQTLSLVTNTLSLTGGGSVDLAPYLDNTDAQTFSLNGDTLSLTNGGSVDLSGYRETWATLSGVPAGFADGTDDVDDADADPTNELQTVSLTGSDLSLSKGGGTVSFAGAITADMLAPGTLSVLGTADGSSAGVLTVDNNGSVGLGTSLPQGALHISGRLRALNSVSTETSGFDYPQEVAGVYAGHVVVRTTTGIKFFDARDTDAVLPIDGPDFGYPQGSNDADVSDNALYLASQFENKVTALELEIEQGEFRTHSNWSIESFVSGGGGLGGAGPTSIDATATHLYVTTGKTGDLETISGTLRVLDATDGSTLGSVGLPIRESPYFVRVADGIAHVLSHGEEIDGTPYTIMRLIDVSDPAAPAMVGSVKGDEFSSLLVSEGRAYLSGEDRVRVYDVTNPASPALLGEAVDHVRVVGGPESPFHLLMGARGLSLSGSTLYVASGEDSSLTLIDVANPAVPALIDEIADGERGLGHLEGAADVFSVDERAYVVAPGEYSMTIFDLTPTGLVVESRVGIGTTDPTAELDVVGTVKATTLEGALDGSFLADGSVSASKFAIGSFDDADADPTNEIQTLSLAGSNLTLSKSGGTISINDADADSTNELQTLSRAGTNLTLSNGGGTISINDADSDPTNEIETWATLVGIPAGFSDGTDDVNDADSDPTNEIETWATLAGIPAGFSDGIDNVDDADANATNEIQTLTLAGSVLSLSRGGGSTDLSSLAGSNPWTASGANIYRSSGRVGILTSNPQSELDVAGTIRGTSFLGTDPGTVRFSGGLSPVLALQLGGIDSFRVVRGVSGSINLIGGAGENTIPTTVGYSVIAGGGSPTSPNSIGANYSAIGGGAGNSVTSGYGTIGGGNGNDVEAESANVSGGYQNTVSGKFATIGGGSGNSVARVDPNDALNNSYGTIGGGIANSVTAVDGTVSGGRSNSVKAARSVVGGGSANAVEAISDHGTISGGNSNLVFGDYATIGGGRSNRVNGDYSAVGGGQTNVASNFHTTIAGGVENEASGSHSTIAGGKANVTSGNFSMIGGGSDNEASGLSSVVAGGFLNTAAGENSFVGGGLSNSAAGSESTIPGGQYCATGTNAASAFAAGFRAKANHAGSFVWADTTNADFASTANNQFLIRAAGGVGIGTNNPECPLDVAGSKDLRFYLEAFLVGTGVGDYPSPGNLDDYPISIRASHSIQCPQFFVNSDSRIKTNQHVSDSEADLVTLLGIQITDYTYIDKVQKKGAQKKVIAQQVEEVYPLAVGTSTGVIPDIYQAASIADGWVALETDLKVGERVKLIGGRGESIHEVLEVAEGRFRTGYGYKSKGEQIFVYGREVDDYRSVDYEAISMLNVSATQELARRLTDQEAENAALKKRVAELEARDLLRENRLTNLETVLRRALGSGGPTTASARRESVPGR